jgi:hypothetical protein
MSSFFLALYRGMLSAAGQVHRLGQLRPGELQLQVWPHRAKGDPLGFTQTDAFSVRPAISYIGELISYPLPNTPGPFQGDQGRVFSSRVGLKSYQYKFFPQSIFPDDKTCPLPNQVRSLVADWTDDHRG